MLNRNVCGCIAESLENRMLLSTGALDSTFSTDGMVTANFNGGIDNAHAVVVQADGKVLVGGNVDLGPSIQGSEIGVVRYNADGTLDDGSTSDSTPGDHFGTGGKFTLAVDTGATVSSMAIQKDGKILLAGWANSTGSEAQQYWLIVRLNPDGTLDNTFGDHGKASFKFGLTNAAINAMTLQSDGKIVVAGSWNGDWLVSRLDPDGTLDSSFGINYVTTDFGGTDSADSVSIDNLGNIVVAGGVGGNGVVQNVGIARYLPNGDLDPNFGQGGKVVDTQRGNVIVNGAVIQPDGQIDVAYSEFNNGWDAETDTYKNDGSFEGGIGGGPEKNHAIALMANGQYVEANEELSNQDTSFSGIHVKLQDQASFLETGDGIATAVATAADGSIFVAGTRDVGSGERDFLLIKVDGVSPTSWGAVSGNVFRDLDADHVLDSNEKGMGSVRVYADLNNDGMLDSDENVLEPSVLTDAHGNFVLRNLVPGNVVIREVVPAGSTQTLPTAASYSVIVSAAKTVKGANFANSPIVSPSTQTAINGSVFYDWNSNGVRDITKPTEPDLSGMTVFIDANKNGILDKHETSTTTDASGNFNFNFSRGGSVRIAIVVPKTLTNTTPAFYDVTVPTHQQVTKRFGLTFKDANDTIAEAAPITIGKAVSGATASPLDVNMYSFTVKAGQTITFDEDAARGSTFDSFLRLFDSKGHTLASNDNGIAPGEAVSLDSALRFKFTAAGTYFIAVSDHLNIAYSARGGGGDIGGGTAGKYALLLSVG